MIPNYVEIAYYIGVNAHPEVNAASQAAIDRYGTSCSASRLGAGERPEQGALERKLAEHYAQDAALVFVSGHATDVAVIRALLGPNDLVIHDAFSQKSIVTGAPLSGATRRPCPHNDSSALDRILASSRAQ